MPAPNPGANCNWQSTPASTLSVKRLQYEAPKDPWGHKYLYEFPPTHGTGEYPDIWSSGPDGKDGSEDDIVNWSKDEQRS